MNQKYKRTAYLAPELPSLSATFVFNEIIAMEKLGVEVHTYSVHEPKNKAHGKRALKMAKSTAIIYNHNLLSNLKDFIINTLTHTRSTFKGIAQLAGDFIKTGIIRKNSFKLLYQFLRANWFARDLRNRNIEHIHIHFAHVSTQIGMYASTLAGISFSFTAHANDIFERPLLIKEKCQRAKKVISISSFNIDVMKRLGGNPSNMEIVRCGVDSTLPIRPLSSMNKRSLKIGSLGRLVEKKGVQTLIEAGRQLKDISFDFSIEIAGDGPQKNELIKLVQKNKLDDHIKFIGAIPHSDVRDWMKSLDIFSLPSQKDSNGDMDGIPVVLMEAMNLGIPVLTTAMSGIPELVIHDKTGLVSQPGDFTGLAENIKKLYINRQLQVNLVANAKKRIKSEFDQLVNAARLKEVFSF